MTFPYGLHLLNLLGGAWRSENDEPLQATTSGAWAVMLTDGAGDGGRSNDASTPTTLLGWTDLQPALIESECPLLP